MTEVENEGRSKLFYVIAIATGLLLLAAAALLVYKLVCKKDNEFDDDFDEFLEELDDEFDSDIVEE